MLRPIITTLLMAFSATSLSAVVAFSVADDNFEMPDHLVQIDLETGEYVSKGQIADPFIALEGLAMSSNGTLYGADDNTKTLVQINTSEGLAFAVNNSNQNFGFGAVPESYDFGMTFSCNDEMHLVVKHTQELYRVDQSTGVASLVGDTGYAFTSLAAWGDQLYAVASGDFNLYRINKDTATAEVVGSMGDLGGDIELTGSGLAFDTDGQLWMVINLRLSDPLNPFPSRIFKLDIDSGQATLQAETLVGIESLAIAPPGGCALGPQPAEPVPGLNIWGILALLLFAGLTPVVIRRH